MASTRKRDTTQGRTAGAAVAAGSSALLEVDGIDGVVARPYLRVSEDASGVLRSPDEQHADLRQDAAEHRWRMGVAYRDEGSASKYAAKPREDFENLIKDLTHDRFGAQILALWEGSRGSRKTSEWVLLIDLCEERSVEIWVHTHRRLYDPRNPHDRARLLEDAIKSELSSAETSLRSRRATAASAAAGRAHGRVPFGYRRRYWMETVSGRLVRRWCQEPDPGEAAVIRELFRRLKKGDSLRGIARDFGERGIRTRSGRVFSEQQLRGLAMNRAYAGERVHDPEWAHGKRTRGKPSTTAQVVKADWQPLVSKALFLSVYRTLTDPSRKTTRPGRGKHFLSSIIPCGECGGKVVVRYKRGTPIYICYDKGCTSIDRDGLDTLIETTITDYLSRLDVYELLAAHDSDNEELAAVQEQIQALRVELEELADRVGAGELSQIFAARTEPGILKRLKAAEDREQELITPVALKDLIGPGEPNEPNESSEPGRPRESRRSLGDVAQRLTDMPMPAKRKLARYLLAPDQLGEPRIIHAPTPHQRRQVTNRIQWHTHRTTSNNPSTGDTGNSCQICNTAKATKTTTTRRRSGINEVSVRDATDES